MWRPSIRVQILTASGGCLYLQRLQLRTYILTYVLAALGDAKQALALLASYYLSLCFIMKIDVCLSVCLSQATRTRCSNRRSTRGIKAQRPRARAESAVGTRVAVSVEGFTGVMLQCLFKELMWFIGGTQGAKRPVPLPRDRHAQRPRRLLEPPWHPRNVASC